MVGSNKPQMTNLIGHEKAAVHLPEAQDQVATTPQEKVSIVYKKNKRWNRPFYWELHLSSLYRLKISTFIIWQTGPR